MTIEDYQALLADVNQTMLEATRLLAAVEKTADSPAVEKLNQLILDGMDKVGQEGEELIDLSFKRGMLLTLFAVLALLLAQILFVYIKKRLAV